ncbi:MAG: pilus assembly protein [Novosphingobium sp.]|nr:pilus assembly protein [Novosphingobium sp.]
MIRLASLRRCNAGATAVEFALLAPIFFMMLFGLIEFSRMAWTKQTIGDVAYATARCMSVSSSCNTSTLQKSYAVKRAAGFGITLTNANVTPATNTTCKGYASSNSVTVTVAFHSPAAGLIPGLPTRLSSVACFPYLT